MLWKTALHNACGPSMRSGQRSALTRVNVSKGVAHSVKKPGGQNAHTVLALLSQQDAVSRDLHADHRAAEQPTARFHLIFLRAGRCRLWWGVPVYLSAP